MLNTAGRPLLYHRDSIMLGFIRRFADKKLICELAEVRADLEAAVRTKGVMQAEIDALAAVLARDRERVHAESAEFAKRVAEAEGKTADVRRDH